jgi:hypothetical protein
MFGLRVNETAVAAAIPQTKLSPTEYERLMGAGPFLAADADLNSRSIGWFLVHFLIKTKESALSMSGRR